MRATAIIFLVLAVGCGSVKDRGSCSTSTDCAAGSYCARTPDGSVCWPDAVPPSVSSVAVSCAAPCLRDGSLHVTASVADDAEVLSADVSLDLSSSITVPMVRSGAGWAADVPLARFPFPGFEHGVHVRVTARDGARNEVSLDAAGVTTATRLRFSKQIDGVVGMTSPAVMRDGTVVVAGTNGRTYFVSWDGAAVSSLAVGSAGISAAPLVAGESVWIGSEDNWVYELTSQARVAANQRANTQGVIKGSLAATGAGRIIATSEAGFVYSVTQTTALNSSPGAPLSLGPVIAEDGSIYVVGGASARRLTLVAGAPTDSWPAVLVGGTVADPLACTTSLLAIANPGSAGLLKRVTAAGDPDHLATLSVPSGGVAILSDQSILVPEQIGTISRWTSTGAPFPGWPNPAVTGAPRTPLVLDGPASFLVPTGSGRVFSLAADGTVAWSWKLSPGTAALQPGNIYTPPPAQQLPGTTLSTAYFAGADGYLHAVIVDGALDGSAPWPKAFHDPQNTNRAGPQP